MRQRCQVNRFRVSGLVHGLDLSIHTHTHVPGGKEESVLCGSEAKSLSDLRFRVSGLVSGLDLGRRAYSAAATQSHSRTAELHKRCAGKKRV